MELSGGVKQLENAGKHGPEIQQMQPFTGGSVRIQVFCLHWITFLMSDPIVAQFYLLIFIAGQNSAALGNTERLNDRLHQSCHDTTKVNQGDLAFFILKTIA